MSYRRPPSKRSQGHQEACREEQEEGITTALDQAENSSQKDIPLLRRSRPHYGCLGLLLAPLLYSYSASSPNYFGLSQSTRNLHSLSATATTNATISEEIFKATTSTPYSLDLGLIENSDDQASSKKELGGTCRLPSTIQKDENGFSFLNSSDLCHHDNVSYKVGNNVYLAQRS